MKSPSQDFYANGAIHCQGKMGTMLLNRAHGLNDYYLFSVGHRINVCPGQVREKSMGRN